MRRAAAIAFVAMLVLVAGGAATATPAARWKPAQGLRWQYQLQGAANVGICATPASVSVPGSRSCVRPNVYVIDLYAANGSTPNAAAVKQIHARHAHAVCYVDAGSWESWRPDAARYPKKLLGKSNGWPGERWLDIRARALLLPILDARVQKCVKAGFDAVDFDEVEGYANATGFPLTGSQQLAFNRALAQMAHTHGLAVGLKNDLGQLQALRPAFDFAVNEQCSQFQECSTYTAWIQGGKPVVEIEYSGSTKASCADAAKHGRDAMHKELALRATPWVPCA